MTLVIDLFFTIVFLAMMFCYAPSLTWIVIGSFPFSIAISAAVPLVFRRRLDEKFSCGAENRALLVENATGIETLKAMVVEPQMQRRWEEPFAGYVPPASACPAWATGLAKWYSSSASWSPHPLLYFSAYLVIDGSPAVGELTAFNMPSGRVAQPALRLVQLWQDFRWARLSIHGG